MEHMKFETPDMVAGNIEKIAELFPSAVTEMRGEDGKVKKGINFEVLKQLLCRDVVDGDECYEFTWVGKKAAMAEAARPTTKTLRPVKEDSKDWDTTENLYIEGDNLEVLKILQESYLGKVKMIYIDPPYNTGHDFVYPDSFMMDNEEYNAGIGYFDEEGNVNFARENSTNAGKYHSDWCSMMYSRLTLARNLLTEDGVVFISIDDNEIENLQKICNDVFGEGQFLACFVWKRRTSSAMDKSKCSTDHEYVVAYKMPEFKALRGTDKDYKGYANPDNDPRGPWTTGDLTVGMTGDMRPNQYYNLIDPATGIVYKPNYNRVWSYIPETMNKLIQENRIVFPNDPEKRPMKKRFASELDSETNPQSTWLDSVGLNTEATRQINDLFGKSMFNYSKPLSLTKTLVTQVASDEDIVLDFFSGSATTAHAVMQLNAEDGGHRKFIMIQLPEPCDEKSEAKKAGYDTICGIGKKRICLAGDKIQKEHPDKDIDIGFRVFRVDDSNMKDVYYHPEELDQMSLTDMVSNIKEDRTDMDLLYSCLLDWGVEINLPHTTTVIDGCTIHNVDNGALIACFDEKVPASVIQYMAKQQPLRAVFRDSGFSADDAKINVEETFKNFSPDTSVRVI